MSDQRQAKRIHISGRVQGVGYRYFVHRLAEQIGIAGYVRNLADGRVEVYAMGTPAQLRALIGELRRGPENAIVEKIGEADAEMAPAFASRFSIEYDDE